MHSPTDPSNRPPLTVDLEVSGAIPNGLSGRLMGIGRDGTLHSVQINARQVSHSVRRFDTKEPLHSLVAFGRSILALGDDRSAYELSAGSDSLRRVDLAGHGQAVAAHPKHDIATGEMHLVARDPDGVQAHVVVSDGALTRRSRPIFDAPGGITDVALSRDHAVFVVDGFVGVAPRDGQARTTWIATGADAPHLVHAHDVGAAVILLTLTPSLES